MASAVATNSGVDTLARLAIGRFAGPVAPLGFHAVAVGRIAVAHSRRLRNPMETAEGRNEHIFPTGPL